MHVSIEEEHSGECVDPKANHLISFVSFGSGFKFSCGHPERMEGTLRGSGPEIVLEEGDQVEKSYRKTCLKRPPHGARNSGRYRQVVS